SETYSVSLGTVTDGTGGQVTLAAPTTDVVTITDNDTASIELTASSSSVGEAAGTFTTNALLVMSTIGTGTQQLDRAATVAVTAANGTALSGVDYTLVTTSVTFAAGATNGATRAITTTILDDGPG